MTRKAMESETGVKNFSDRFGNNLRELRAEKHLTQEQVAEQIAVGVSTYANWEQGRREPSLYHLLCLASIFEVDMNTLFDFDSEIK